MRLTAAASSALRPVLAGPAQPARWLGATRAALYLETAGLPGVLAVLAHDATRLPCGLVLPSTSQELPLTSLAPGRCRCLVGDGKVAWTGPGGPVEVRVVREWAPGRAAAAIAGGAALAHVRAALPPPAATGVDPRLIAQLRDVADSTAVVVRLIGRGPGLTPSGDDVLAGFLVGARVFGLHVPGILGAVGRLAAARTTALSAGLLWHAAQGQCIDELAALAAALTGSGATDLAVRRLLAVGHMSGAALAHGLVVAAERALGCRTAA
jgi:hypothetical protein